MEERNRNVLPPLKNDKERAAFIDAYAVWPLWIETEETKERYYRYDLPDGTAMAVRVLQRGGLRLPGRIWARGVLSS